MDFDSLDPRVIAAIAVTALLPVLWYAVSRSSSISYVAVINVLVVAGALRIAMGPTGSTRAEPGH